jgi:hypothetical protein
MIVNSATFSAYPITICARLMPGSEVNLRTSYNTPHLCEKQNKCPHYVGYFEQSHVTFVTFLSP